MYTITFYSFKGGVGRTMALVNVAAELVRSGRKVLVVDFDLEAPGLETYKHLSPPKPHPGIVEYVTKFDQTLQVPDIHDYIFEAPRIGKKEGRLWVMPAGRRDIAYRKALVNLDWKRMYREREGFLFFEETKKAWEEEYKPDYLLIDSRTGDTDVLGICTRQLPDSVVLLFVPNEQNLAGLENVCKDIRREKDEGLKKEIRLHFVAANVPDLDDENDVLCRQKQKFQQRLGFEDYSGIIRRYESLDLLDQSVFVLDRPRTRLARSYRELTAKLVSDNLADRKVAVLYLQSDAFFALDVDLKNPDHPFNRILNHFFDDSEIFTLVAKCLIKLEEFRHAERVLNRALTLNPNQPDALFARAQCERNLNQLDEAVKDYLHAISLPEKKSQDVTRSLEALRDIAPDRMNEAVEILESQEFHGIAIAWVANLLSSRKEGVPRAAELLRKQLKLRAESQSGWELLEALRRARCWKEIIKLYETQDSEELPYYELLDVAIAYWAETGKMPADLCQQALQLEHEFGGNPEVGIWLLWGAGRITDALESLQEAEKSIGTSSRLLWGGISPWSLDEEISPEQYLADCQLVRRFFQGEPLRPAFLEPPSTS